MNLDAATAIACDPDAPVRERVEALETVVETVSIEEVEIPERIVAALDDPAFVSAAIAMRRTSAVCAAFHQLGDRAELASTRKRVVRRLVAAGATGIELAGLAISIGDVVPGATLAVREFETTIAGRMAGGPPDPLVGAWLGWLADQPDTAAVAVLRRLAISQATDFDTLFTFATNPTQVGRLRGLARSIVPS